MFALSQRQAPPRTQDVGQPERPISLPRLARFLVVLVLFAAVPVIEQILGGGRGLVLGMLLMALVPSLLRAGGPRFHPLDPETLIPAAFFLSSGYAPTVHLLTSTDFTLHEIELPALTVAFLGAGACAILCTVASPTPDPAPEPLGAAQLHVTPIDRAAIFTGLFGMAMIVGYIGFIGFDAMLQMSYGETYLAEQGLGMLVSGWFVIQFAAVYLVVRCTAIYRVGARIPRVLLAALALFVLAYAWNTVMGRRGPLIWLFASMALAAHIGGVVVRRAWFVVALFALAFYSFAVEGMRTSLGEGVDSQVASARHRLDLVDNPLVLSELEAVWNNLVVIVNEKPSLVEYPGESLVVAVLAQVPRPIWPDRPQGLSARYVMWLDPTIGRAGGGFAFNAAAEGYINFGEVGAALESLLMTLVFFGPVSACIRRRKSSILQALSVCIASYAYNQYRGEVASLLKIIVTFLATVLMIEVLSMMYEAVFVTIPHAPSDRGPRPRPRRRAAEVSELSTGSP